MEIAIASSSFCLIFHAIWTAWTGSRVFHRLMRRQKALSGSVTKGLADVERTATLPHVRIGRRADRHGVRNLLVEEVELDLGADGIVKEHLVARVLDVLLLEIDADLLQALPELDRARSL